MERCWNADPTQRPSADDICDEVQAWSECSKKPWHSNADTIESILSGCSITDFDAVEQLKQADKCRKPNKQLLSKNASAYQSHTSRFVPLVTTFSDSRQEDCVIHFSKGTQW
jgi:hypothetical protein